MSREAILQQALSLSPEDRVKLIDELVESVADLEAFPELSSEQLAELDRRTEAYHANPEAVLTWEEAEKRIFSPK